MRPASKELQRDANVSHGGARFGHRDMKVLSALKVALMGRGQKSRLPLSTKERRLIRRHASIVARIMEALP